MHSLATVVRRAIRLKIKIAFFPHTLSALCLTSDVSNLKLLRMSRSCETEGSGEDGNGGIWAHGIYTIRIIQYDFYHSFRLSTYARVSRKTPKSFTKLNNWHDYSYESWHVSAGMRIFDRIMVSLPELPVAYKLLYLLIFMFQTSTSLDLELRPHAASHIE